MGYFDGRGWSKLPSGVSDYYRCVRKSYINIRFAMNPDRSVWSLRPRNSQYDYQEQFFEAHDDGDCWAAREEAPSRMYEIYAEQ
jgi:hypothetical protein